MSKRNVHYYIQRGLLRPETNAGNGYYEFSQEDCQRLQIIRALRNAGFSIAQIRAILVTPSTSVYYLNQKLKQLKATIAHTSKSSTASAIFSGSFRFTRQSGSWGR